MKAFLRKWRLWIGLVALSFASAATELLYAPTEPSYLAATPTIFQGLRKAVQSSSDLSMFENLAASVKGIERHGDRIGQAKLGPAEDSTVKLPSA